MQRVLATVLAVCLSLGSAWAQATPAPAGIDLSPKVSGAALDIQDGKLTASVQRVSVGTFIAVDRFSISVAYDPGASLLLSPVTTVLDMGMRDTRMSIARIALDLKPLQQGGVQLPGGLIASLIKAQVEAFDTREISMNIRAGKLTFAAKSGILHTKLEAGMGWAEGHQLALRVDSIRLNFGLPIPRKLIMKRLAWLDPLDWADVRENTIVLHVDRLAKLLAESLPRKLHLKLPDESELTRP